MCFTLQRLLILSALASVKGVVESALFTMASATDALTENGTGARQIRGGSEQSARSHDHPLPPDFQKGV
jgi:hypothetical protein